MKSLLKKLQVISVAALGAFNLVAMAGDTIIMNGRSFQLEPMTKPQYRGKNSTASSINVTVRDLTSGQISVYADGLIITFKDALTLTSVLNDYPAVKMQYAPGAYAYVQVPRDQLAATFNALSADARVAAVHLRPLPTRIKRR